MYSGKRLQEVPKKDLIYSNHTVTFRFTKIIENGTENYLIQQSSHYSKESSKYISSLNIFQHIERIEFPYLSVSLQSKDKLKEILLSTIPEIKTDYFIDIYNISLFKPHGGGMGMWGGLLSVLSLGIIPSWWHNQSTYVVNVFKNGKLISSTSIKEDYHAFHSTLFYLIPSSEKSFRKSPNSVEENSLRTILKKIEK